MPEEQFEEKTEKPTPRKREEVRKRGEVAKSRDLSASIVLLFSILILWLIITYFYTNINIAYHRSINVIESRLFHSDDIMAFTKDMSLMFLKIISPFMLFVFIIAIFSNIIQTGFLVSFEQIRPNLSKINPIAGLKRLISLNAFIEFLKSSLKIIFIGLLAYLFIKKELIRVIGLSNMEVISVIKNILYSGLKLSLKSCVVIMIISILDYAYQRWQFENKIKMSRLELKEEFKKTEGDPLIKSRIKSLQLQMARKRILQEVPKADVVITNPIHIAVAIRYSFETMNAPQVIAKGKGLIAQKIKEIAERYQIPIIENREVAHILYNKVEEGHEIPPFLYKAIAEILAYVYRLKGKVKDMI